MLGVRESLARASKLIEKLKSRASGIAADDLRDTDFELRRVANLVEQAFGAHCADKEKRRAYARRYYYEGPTGKPRGRPPKRPEPPPFQV